MKNSEIAQIVSRTKQNDKSAFEELYLEMWKTVYFLSRSYLKNDEDAKDVVQEVFIKLYSEIKNLKSDCAFNEWIRRITFNLCMDFLRKRKNKKTDSIDETKVEVVETRKLMLPEDEFLQNELHDEIFSFINELSEAQRQTIILYYFQECEISEIASLLSTTEVAIYNKLTRARSKLRSKFAEINSRGNKMYGVVGFPLLGPMFQEQVNKLGSIELQQAIWGGIEPTIVMSTITTSVAGVTAGRSVLASLTAFKIPAITIALVGSIGTIYFFKNLNQPEPSRPLQEVLPITLPIQTLTKEPPAKVTIESLLSSEDLNTLNSWRTVTPNNYVKLKDFLDRNSISMSGHFFDSQTDKSMYVLYTIQKENMQLLLCEYYNSSKREWAVRYLFQNNPIPIPSGTEIKMFYENN